MLDGLVSTLDGASGPVVGGLDGAVVGFVDILGNISSSDESSGPVFLAGKTGNLTAGAAAAVVVVAGGGGLEVTLSLSLSLSIGFFIGAVFDDLGF